MAPCPAVHIPRFPCLPTSPFFPPSNLPIGVHCWFHTRTRDNAQGHTRAPPSGSIYCLSLSTEPHTSSGKQWERTVQSKVHLLTSLVVESPGSRCDCLSSAKLFPHRRRHHPTLRHLPYYRPYLFVSIELMYDGRSSFAVCQSSLSVKVELPRSDETRGIHWRFQVRQDDDAAVIGPLLT